MTRLIANRREIEMLPLPNGKFALLVQWPGETTGFWYKWESDQGSIDVDAQRTLADAFLDDNVNPEDDPRWERIT